eukprot:3138723-Prymnesium_polylepis.1
MSHGQGGGPLEQQGVLAVNSTARRDLPASAHGEAGGGEEAAIVQSEAVSYTHLTLPTICSV